MRSRHDTSREAADAPAEAGAAAHPGTQASQRPPVEGAPAEVQGSSPAPPSPVSAGLTQLLRLLGSVVAPATLLTALLFYFGWSHAFWYFEYFGVHSTVLGLTTQDYVMRSVDGLFVPVAVAAAAALLLAGAHLLLVRTASRSAWRAIGLGAGLLGLMLLTVGLSGVLLTTVFEVHPLVSPLCLVAGPLLLVYASRCLGVDEVRAGRGRRPPEWPVLLSWAAVFVFVAIGLFWAATDYSAAVGVTRARNTVARLGTYPDALLYSAESLSLGAPGVREVPCEDPEASYRYRYDGLKLVLQSGGQYVFLPEAWSRADGVAIVLPRSDAVRLEFRSPSAPDPGAATC